MHGKQKRHTYLPLALTIVLGLSAWLHAAVFYPRQTPPPPADDVIELDHADEMLYDQFAEPGARRFRGHVRFRHGADRLTCDSAVYFENDQRCIITGHVDIQTPKARILCDSAVYYGAERIYQAYYNVDITQRGSRLKGEKAIYQERDGTYQAFTDVRIWHNGSRLTCQEATFNEQTQDYNAFRDVVIVRGDTLTLRGNELRGNRGTQIAILSGDVSVENNDKFLYTDDELYYDGAKEFMKYENGGQLINGDDNLTSLYGEYHTDTDDALFLNDVRLKNPDYELFTDTLHYNTTTKLARIEGNSNIISGDYKIFTTNGHHNTDSEDVHLFERSKLDNVAKRLHIEADSVHYNKLNGHLQAFGDVYCIDGDHKVILNGDHAEYFENKTTKTDSSFVTGHALVREYSNAKDTVYLHADTLRLFTYDAGTQDANRIMKAYRRVRLYRSDVQAVCDSLNYFQNQQYLSLYRDPIVWSDERQILGEEIDVWTNDSTADSIHVLRQALLAERIVGARGTKRTYYNQVGAQQLRAYFDAEGELERGEADGNACAAIFPLENDSTMLYQNYLEAAKMRMTTRDRKLKRFWVPTSATGTFYNIGTAPPERTDLPGFIWFDYIRPTGPDDVFRYQPKHAGSELRTIPRREAPVQTLKGSGE
ncbi:MAG: hypothetical protein IJ586_01565 [Alloprevotella sp.]|nr:hypothetical protein [Alloprevotella sp.]